MSDNIFPPATHLKLFDFEVWLIIDTTHKAMFSGTRTQFWVRVPERVSGTRLPEIPDPALPRCVRDNWSWSYPTEPNCSSRRMSQL